MKLAESTSLNCDNSSGQTIQISTGTLFGEAIRRITNEESVSSLFNTGSNVIKNQNTDKYLERTRDAENTNQREKNQTPAYQSI